MTPSDTTGVCVMGEGELELLKWGLHHDLHEDVHRELSLYSSRSSFVEVTIY